MRDTTHSDHRFTGPYGAWCPHFSARIGTMMLALTATAAAQPAAKDAAIDTARSTMTVHVGKAGLFSAAGHEHWVDAPLSTGKIGMSPAPHAEFTVEASKMMVKPDPKVDAKTQAEIQRTMQDTVLESKKYPLIVFRSSNIQKVGELQWRVEGSLTLHGVTKPVNLIVKQMGEAYAGHTALKQTDFGIKPVSVGGGVVKTKDELDLDFQIAAVRE